MHSAFYGGGSGLGYDTTNVDLNNPATLQPRNIHNLEDQYDWQLVYHTLPYPNPIYSIP
jgi:hypothetical protein